MEELSGVVPRKRTTTTGVHVGDSISCLVCFGGSGLGKKRI